MDIDERVGTFMFFIGVIMLIFGLLFLTPLGSIISACNIFVGITLSVFGLLIRLGFFYGKLLSLNGLGTLLICLSVVLFALSLSLMQFVKFDIHNIVPLIFRGAVIGYKLATEYERIYVHLCSTLLRFALLFFIVGVIIKIYNVVKT
jgi:hypothetical protein